MILGIIISAISAFFIHNQAQPYCFGLGCIIFIIGGAIKEKEEEDEIQNN